MKEMDEACCGPRHDRRRLCDPWDFGRGARRDCLVRSFAARVLTQFISPACRLVLQWTIAAGNGVRGETEPGTLVMTITDPLSAGSLCLGDIL
jgi:hypothetical protein